MIGQEMAFCHITFVASLDGGAKKHSNHHIFIILIFPLSCDGIRHAAQFSPSMQKLNAK
jgi:hypothetical protein